MREITVTLPLRDYQDLLARQDFSQKKAEEWLDRLILKLEAGTTGQQTCAMHLFGAKKEIISEILMGIK